MNRLSLKEQRNYIKGVFLLVFIMAAASVIGYFFRHLGFPETNIVMVYLLAVLISSCLSSGYVFGISASIIGTLAFNWLFTEPYFSFSVNDPSYIITFAVMTVTALIASTMTSRVKQSAMEAKKRESETMALYSLMNHLTDSKDRDDIASIAVRFISECLLCQAACLTFDENGNPENTFIQQGEGGRQVRRQSGDIVDIKKRMEVLRTSYDEGNEFYDWPIYGQNSILGIIRIPSQFASEMNDSQTKLLRSMIESIALAMDRFQAALQKMKAREEAVQERYRANLLRAISHDLRTPLSSIIGTSEMLMDMSAGNENDALKYNLAESINKDADWLHSLVENILSLTRLQDGRLTISKEKEAVEEIVGVAISHISKRYPSREIEVNVPEELLMVPMDAKLIEQVLVNLLDNAVEHTKENDEISLKVHNDGRNAVFCIDDRGEGIKEEDLSVIFQAFYTSRGRLPDAQRGIGLGLTICEAIVQAHGGEITAKNREGSGSEFKFTLPLEEK